MTRAEEDRLLAEADAYQMEANAAGDRAEVNRLRKLNAELLNILRRIIDRATAPMSDGDIDNEDVRSARAAIARAEGGAA